MKQVEKKVYRANENHMIEIDGKEYNIYNLPDGLVINGDLDLSYLDLTEQPDLSKIIINGILNLSGNPLKKINSNKLPKKCGGLQLISCGLTTQPDLSKIIIKGILNLSLNPLKEIHPNRLPKKCGGLQLISCGLYFTPNLSETNIKYLNISANNLTEINQKSLPQGIIKLECDLNEQITELDLTSVKTLEELSCNSCDITKLHIPSKLEKLSCMSNEHLTELDLRKAKKLKFLDCKICDIRELLTNSKNLKELNCSFNSNLNTPPKLLVKPKYFHYDCCGFTKNANWKQTYLETIQKAR